MNERRRDLLRGCYALLVVVAFLVGFSGSAFAETYTVEAGTAQMSVLLDFPAGGTVTTANNDTHLYVVDDLGQYVGLTYHTNQVLAEYEPGKVHTVPAGGRAIASHASGTSGSVTVTGTHTMTPKDTLDAWATRYFGPGESLYNLAAYPQRFTFRGIGTQGSIYDAAGVLVESFSTVDGYYRVRTVPAGGWVTNTSSTYNMVTVWSTMAFDGLFEVSEPPPEWDGTTRMGGSMRGPKVRSALQSWSDTWLKGATLDDWDLLLRLAVYHADYGPHPDGGTGLTGYYGLQGAHVSFSVMDGDTVLLKESDYLLRYTFRTFTDSIFRDNGDYLRTFQLSQTAAPTHVNVVIDCRNQSVLDFAGDSDCSYRYFYDPVTGDSLGKSFDGVYRFKVPWPAVGAAVDGAGITDTIIAPEPDGSTDDSAVNQETDMAYTLVTHDPAANPWTEIDGAPEKRGFFVQLSAMTVAIFALMSRFLAWVISFPLIAADGSLVPDSVQSAFDYVLSLEILAGFTIGAFREWITALGIGLLTLRVVRRVGA